MRLACEQYKAQKMDDRPQNQPKLSLRFGLNCNLQLNFKYMITQMSKNTNQTTVHVYIVCISFQSSCKEV